MEDRTPKYPGRIKLTPVPGQADTYDMVRVDEPTQEGTPLNKANLLQDSVAKMYGLSEAAVPNDVFAFLGKYNLHWWRRRINTATAGWFEKRTLGTGRYDLFGAYSTTGGNQQSVQYTGNISISQENGSISYPNPTSITIHYNNAQSVHNSYLKGSYIKSNINGYNRWVYIPVTASIHRYTGRDDDYYVEYEAGQYYEVSSEYKTGGTIGDWEYLFSADANAYPKSGIVGGYEYEYVGIPFENFVETTTKISVGEYVGTGTYGEGNPNSLTFEFEPKLFLVFDNVGAPICQDRENTAGPTVSMAFVGAVPTIYTQGAICVSEVYSSPRVYYGYGKRSEDGKTLTWYHTAYAGGQWNESSVIYRYVAIG